MLARVGRPFRETDPYFGADLGFFVYWLPLREHAVELGVPRVIVVVGVAVILLYALTPSLKWQRGSLYASTYVRRHFTVLAGVLLLMLAWSFRLDMYALLLDGSGADGAFSYVDHRVGIPGDLVLSLATLARGADRAVGRLRRAVAPRRHLGAQRHRARRSSCARSRRRSSQHSGTDASARCASSRTSATRAAFTRRAFAVDVHAARRFDDRAIRRSPPRCRGFPAWDPPALARAIDGGRAGDDAERRASAGATSREGLVADVVDPPPPGRVGARAVDVGAHSAPRTRTSAARRCASRAPTASAIDDTPIEAPLVFPGAPHVRPSSPTR